MRAILLRESARDTGLISWRACRWSVARIFPVLCVLLNLIALSACISTSRVSPERQPGSGPSHPSRTHVTFQIEPYGSGQSRHHPTGNYALPRPCYGHFGPHGGEPGLKKAFEESFDSATYVLTSGLMGTHVYIEILQKPLPSSESCGIQYHLASMTLTALPWYYDGLGYVVLYHLYLDGKLQHTYRYEITQKGIVWLPLGLLIWMNYFTTGETEAFEETARQFAVDAERDGYFQAPSER